MRILNHLAITSNSRRSFIKTMASVAGAMALNAKTKEAPKVIFRSAWQTVNIGDIAHTPGFLKLMETYLPNVQVTLWPSDIGEGVKEILEARFPKLKFAETENEIRLAFKECDFFIHGSAASLSGMRQIERWEKETGKPFGIYGITFDDHQSWRIEKDTPEEIERRVDVINRSAFIYFRDRESLQKAKDYGCRAPIMDFAPDAAFATDLRDEGRASAYLDAHKLEKGKFICCIPRYRFSPYWLMKEHIAIDLKKDKINQEMKEQDHAPLRLAVKKIVKETDLKVLLCPEDVSQIQLNKDLIYDHLTPAEKERVVWKSDYWLTGEAVSVYKRSAGLFGNEMHSPIMCIGNGIPAIVCRWEGQTSKGTMWNDIGLSEWLFNFDIESDRNKLPDAVLDFATNIETSFKKARMAKERVNHYQRRTMKQVGDLL